MKGFRLIAVIPLLGCDKKYRKNLQIGTPYQFYSDFDFKIKKDFSEVVDVKPHPAKSSHGEYILQNGINLNISAVVGKNGSGKSTLLELLYYLIYLISVEKKKGGNETKTLISPYSQDLIKQHDALSNDWQLFERMVEIQNKISAEKKLSKDDHEFISENGYDPVLLGVELIQKYDLEKAKKALSDQEALLKWIKQSLVNKQMQLYNRIKNIEEPTENELKSNFRLSIIYSIDDSIFELLHNEHGFKQSQFDNGKTPVAENVDGFDLNSFSYTISVNYSHHALNSSSLGNWISKLFHKNDAYTTPVVINPMREKGNFKINKELSLSKERLMANLLFDLVNGKTELLNGKYSVSSIIFRPKSPLIYPLHYDEEFVDSLMSGELLKSIGIKKLENYTYWEQAISYIEKKIVRIEKNYSFLYKSPDVDELGEDENVVDFIQTDRSHVTKKVRQVLNFLKLSSKNPTFWKHGENTLETVLKPEELLTWLTYSNEELKKKTPSELLEIALPGFFNVDFNIDDGDGGEFEFNRLSSGEQQSILNINSILYHLFNLQSVHSVRGQTESKNERVCYSNVNILLDEVELYYHPEMQRKIINEIVGSFERIKRSNQNGIENINLCLLTHSPFILSDVYSKNTLKLTTDNKTNDAIPMKGTKESFGANIYDMLSNDFFMEEGFIGEFAKNEIELLLGELYEIQSKHESISKSYFESLKRRVEFIGERMIRVRLLDILNDIPTQK